MQFNGILKIRSVLIGRLWLIGAWLALSCTGNAAEWPSAGHDVRRTAITAESLNFPLHEAWQFHSAQPSPAWPPPHFIMLDRMDFDNAPQPVVAEGIVCFGSSTDDTVRAVDLKTGRQRWRFVTGGPVRLAPQISDGRVYFGSDDGCAYCLSASTGLMIWKFDAAPHEEKFLGNGRMISRWPIRTGVLVDQGIAYLVAGMWASEGVFAYALNSETGEIVWCNDTCGHIGVDYNHLLTPENAGEMRHGVHDGDFGVYGLTPQGALAVTRDVLLVPNGYNSPAGLDRKTGKVLFGDPQAGTGGHWLTAEDDVYYTLYQHRNRRILMLKRDAKTGERISFRFHEIHNVTKEPNEVPHLHQELGKTRNLIVDGKIISRNAYAIALAGTTLILGRDGYVIATDLETSAELWRAPVQGKAYGLAIADGCLIASTDQGYIHCFATPAVDKPRIVDVVSASDDSPRPAWFDTLQRTGMDCGYALVLGDAKGELCESLARHTRLNLVAWSDDPQQASAVQARLVDQTSLYGSRIHALARATESVQGSQASALPFAQHFANAVIVAGPTKVASEELYRVLRPCGGVARAAIRRSAHRPAPCVPGNCSTGL